MSPQAVDRLVGFALLAAALVLLAIYARGQLAHTVRFLADWLTGSYF
jgi:hypothetical protein